MRSEPTWLTADELIQLNAIAVGATGEPFNVLNPGLLGSAQAKPINHWYYGEDDIVALAVELLFGIARNHCFEQGNKRTALLAAGLFLEYNALMLMIEDSEHFADLIVEALMGDIAGQQFADILRRHVQPTAEGD